MKTESVLSDGTVTSGDLQAALLPCPHCGGAAICDPWPAGRASYYKVLCRAVISCCASGGAFPTQAEAIAAWNRRAK